MIQINDRKYGKDYADNHIDSLLGFNTVQTWNVTSGTGSAILDTDIVFEGNSSLKIENTDTNTNIELSNSAQNTVIPYAGDFNLSFYTLKNDPNEFFGLDVNIFKNGVFLATAFTVIGSENTEDDINNQWVRYQSSAPYTFAKGDVVTFTLSLGGGSAIGNPTMVAWLDGMMLSATNRQSKVVPTFVVPNSLEDEVEIPINYVNVNSKSNFPVASSGVINLLDGYTYVLNGDIDLTGDRLVSNNAVINLYGRSSETSSLTSTGLDAGTALITTNTTIKLGDLTIKDVGTGISLNKDTIMALDWYGVNFVNIPNLWNIGDFDNMILNLCTISGCNNGVFTGEFGTFAITESPLIGDGSVGSVLEFQSTVVCNRRIRIQKNPIVAFGSTTGITVDAGITLATEQFILTTNTFSGGSTYLGGIDYTDVRTDFRENTGIRNTNKGAVSTITTEAVTTITTQNDWVDLAGTFTLTNAQHLDSPVNGQTRSLDDNEATYNTQGSVLIQGTAGDVIQARITVFRDATSTFEPQDVFQTIISASQGADFGTISMFDTIRLGLNDYQKVEARNTTSTNNFTALENGTKFKLTGV